MQYYREAHLELVRKLFCPSPRPSSNVANAFTESTNLSLPLKKKLSNLSKPERSDQSDLGEPSANPNIIVLKDSLQERSAKVSDPLKEGKFSTHTESKMTLELKEWDWDSKEQVRRGGLEENQLKCKQPIHLSASLQVDALNCFLLLFALGEWHIYSNLLSGQNEKVGGCRMKRRHRDGNASRIVNCLKQNCHNLKIFTELQYETSSTH